LEAWWFVVGCNDLQSRSPKKFEEVYEFHENCLWPKLISKGQGFNFATRFGTSKLLTSLELFLFSQLQQHLYFANANWHSVIYSHREFAECYVTVVDLQVQEGDSKRMASKNFAEMTDEFVVGIIGMGDMGKMYARRLSDAGWR
jgi:hypothetical protein